MKNTETNVPAQASDEPMLEEKVQAQNLRGMAKTPAAVMYGYGARMAAAADTIDRLVALATLSATVDVKLDEVTLKAAIIAALVNNTREMEGYSYFGSNPGVPEDEYEEVADEIIAATKGAKP